MALSKPNSNEATFAATVLTVIALPFALALGVLMLLYHGWAGHIVWNLLAPKFFGLAEITYLQATAGLVVIGFARMTSYKTDHKVDWFKWAVQPLILIALAYTLTLI